MRNSTSHILEEGKRYEKDLGLSYPLKERKQSKKEKKGWTKEFCAETQQT